MTEKKGITPKQLVGLFMPADEFIAQDIPPRTWLVEGVIPHASLGMLYAYRGVGKTLTTMDLALALAGARPWLGYQVPKARTGLYIDGEMPRSDMIVRLKAQANGKPLPQRLNILSAEALALKHWNLNLAQENDRQMLSYAIATWEKHHEAPMEFLVLDNWTSLIRGLDENDNSQMDALKSWLIMLRHAGISVILVHHTGKDGRTQRGGSAREDVLDYSIRLRRHENQSDQAFFLEWDKARSGLPSPSSFPCEIVNDGANIRIERMEKAERQNSTSDLIVETIRTLGPQGWNELLQLGIPKGTLHRRLDALLAKKKINKMPDGRFDIDA